jgi:hypothetical protein
MTALLNVYRAWRDAALKENELMIVWLFWKCLNARRT